MEGGQRLRVLLPGSFTPLQFSVPESPSAESVLEILGNEYGLLDYKERTLVIPASVKNSGKIFERTERVEVETTVKSNRGHSYNMFIFSGVTCNNFLSFF